MRLTIFFAPKIFWPKNCRSKKSVVIQFWTKNILWSIPMLCLICIFSKDSSMAEKNWTSQTNKKQTRLSQSQSTWQHLGQEICIGSKEMSISRYTSKDLPILHFIYYYVGYFSFFCIWFKIHCKKAL